MEIKLLQREAPVWITGETIHKQASFQAETVVPDTAEDVREIVWAHGWLLLKGKEPGLNGSSVTGEALASVLYLTESGMLESLRLRKEFTIDFEAGASDPEALPQVTWYLSAVQAKLLNPRKLRVNFEIQASLRIFERGSALTETALQEGDWKGLHIRQERQDALVTTAITEKQFTLREQLSFPDGQQPFAEIDREVLRFDELETEQIGSRCIVKGEAHLSLWGRDAEGLPTKAEFQLPVSQLLDITEDPLDQCSIWIETNSIYLDWTEGSGAERSLDLEIHALLQLCAYSSREVITISDAYSTAMPLKAEFCARDLLCAAESGTSVLRTDASLALPDDMAELLVSEAKLGPLESNLAEAQILLYVDLLYRRTDGSLGAARRSIKLDASELPENVQVLSAHVHSFSAEPRERQLHLYGEVQILWETMQTAEVRTASLLSLDEDNRWSRTESPSLFLVRRGEEPLWELAKQFRSSVALIRSCNEEDADLLLIPAEI